VTGGVVCLALVIAAFVAARAAAAGEKPDEYRVKAAFIVNFARFVEWPNEAFADAGSPIIVGVVGDDPFDGALGKALSGRTAHGRSLVCRRVKVGPEMRACHLLFISASERKRLKQLLGMLRETSVLTIGEVGEFTESGGIINFLVADNRVGFEVNVGAAEEARLKISSRVLRLAREVTGRGGGDPR